MKLQVIVDNDVVSRIDAEAQKRGLSRSSYCGQAILLQLAKDEESAKPTDGEAVALT